MGKKNRPAENIEYVSKWLNEFGTNSFDIIVTVEVIEHIKNYSLFLEELVRIAPISIITTPNKNRSKETAKASPPIHESHVREWTAGEFYWVLKVFFKEIDLYAMPNVYLPAVTPIGIISNMTPLIAVCRR